MKTLLIDDIRDIEATIIARTYAEGIQALVNDGPFDVLYLDHDLGEPNPGYNGYGIMCWLEANQQYLPKEIVLVTANPVGRKNMQVVIDLLYNKESR